MEDVKTESENSVSLWILARGKEEKGLPIHIVCALHFFLADGSLILYLFQLKRPLATDGSVGYHVGTRASETLSTVWAALFLERTGLPLFAALLSMERGVRLGKFGIEKGDRDHEEGCHHHGEQQRSWGGTQGGRGTG